jgi:hypothetical protein
MARFLLRSRRFVAARLSTSRFAQSTARQAGVAVDLHKTSSRYLPDLMRTHPLAHDFARSRPANIRSQSVTSVVLWWLMPRFVQQRPRRCDLAKPDIHHHAARRMISGLVLK